MKFEGRTKILVIVIIAAVGVSGVFEALPHASESAGDLLIDGGILAAAMGVSYLLARLLGRRSSTRRS